MLSTGSKGCRISSSDLLLHFSKQRQHASVEAADGKLFDDDFFAQLSCGTFQLW